MTVEEALDILRPYHSERAESFKMDLAAAPYWNEQLNRIEELLMESILGEV